jgi:hypothetical protein
MRWISAWPIAGSSRWWFIKKPTVPSFMPNTGLPRPPWRWSVCSMNPSPPRATSTSAASGSHCPCAWISAASAFWASSAGLARNDRRGAAGRLLFGVMRARITRPD